MTDEIKPDNDLPVPSLTLEPNLDESGAIELVEETTVETEPAPKAELDESALSPEEKVSLALPSLLLKPPGILPTA